MVLTLSRGTSVRQDSFDFSDAKANVNMQSNKVTLDDTVSVTTRHFSGVSESLNRLKLVFLNPSAVLYFPSTCMQRTYKWMV